MDGWSTSNPGHFTPGKGPGTNRTGRWVGPRATGVKMSPVPGLDTWPIQLVANRFTGYAIAALW